MALENNKILPYTMSWRLYVDDLRTAPAHWLHVTSSAQALVFMHLLRENDGKLSHLSLDHDLGGDDTTRPIMMWMAENDWWPEHLYVHTANPVGREWLFEMAKRYALKSWIYPYGPPAETELKEL